MSPLAQAVKEVWDAHKAFCGYPVGARLDALHKALYGLYDSAGLDCGADGGSGDCIRGVASGGGDGG